MSEKEALVKSSVRCPPNIIGEYKITSFKIGGIAAVLYTADGTLSRHE